MINQIVTHAGKFHADEITACALISVLMEKEIQIVDSFTPTNFNGKIKVIRTYNPTPEHFENPETWVLDIGKKLSFSHNNYDHHQDGNIPATNMLILNRLVEDVELRKELEIRLFNYIDKVDRGIIVEQKADQVPTYNSIIRNCNSIFPKGFEIALSIAINTVTAMISQAKESILSIERYKSCEQKGQVLLNTTLDNFIVDWKEMAEEDGLIAQICPNIRKEGSYSIISRDTNIFKIPPIETQTFLHASGFIASYDSLDDAIDHCKKLNIYNF